MKKLILSIIIATSIISLAGCSTKSNSEINELNKKLEDAYITVDKLEQKVNELSKQIDESNEIRIKSYASEKENVSAQISISYLSDYDKYEEVIESFKGKFADEGKTVIAPNKEPLGDRIFIIKTEETIKDITLNSLGSEFINDFGCNIEEYLNEYGVQNKGNLISELNKDEVLIFTAHESEGIPSCYFSWTEPDGTTIYNTVIYDGKGDFYK